jgi:hypothetical protein
MSKTVEEMKRELAEAYRIENDAHQRAQILAQLIADATCPLKVGQVVPVCGYSHNGKQMRIEQVWPGRSRSDDWQVRGRVLKQDGTDGKHTADFDQHQWEAKQARAAIQKAEGK